MYRQRLERDGVHPRMCPETISAPGEAVATAPTASPMPADGPAPTPPPSEEQPATTAAESRQLSSSIHSESSTQGQGGRGGGGGGGKENATAASTTTVASAPASSGLVPRGAYRRLVCIPADVSWESTISRADDGAGGVGENPIGLGPSASSRTDENTIGVAPASGAGAAPVVGSVGDGRGTHLQGDSGAQDKGVAKGGGMAATTRELSALLEDIRLTFTLPPGSFATMFLREVMKRNDDIVWEGPGGKEGGEGRAGIVEVDGK